MLNLITNLSHPQKRVIMLVLDCALIAASLFLSFAVQFEFDGNWYALRGYLPLLPYLLICTVCMSLYLDFDHVRLASYDAGSVIRIATLSATVGIFSITLGWVGNVQVPLSIYIMFSVLFYNTINVNELLYAII